MPGKATITLIATLFCCILCSSVAQAAEARWDAVGFRAGADVTDHHEPGQNNFEVYELFGYYALPWKWGRSSAVELGTRLDGSAGMLRRSDDAAFLATLGPSIAFKFFSERLEIDAGVSAAYLSEHKFSGRDLGGPLQFVSHGGIGVLVGWNVVFGYHFQHISNAGIFDYNPGVNLHTLELRYRL